ncbi:MAG: phosphotransferase, partial [Bacteroidales bacterium]|nr:phosphotransferase [Bacteroidales bacterium]
MKELEKLFEQYTKQKPESIYELPSSGSNRRYFRISGSGITLIGAKGTSIEENIAFMEIAKHFKLKGLPVPQVLCASSNNEFYLQEDLGDITLFNTIEQGRETSNFSPDEISLLKKTISTLPRLQFEGGKGLDYNICFPQPEFDERNVWFDFNYFKYCFLKTTGIEFSEIKLHDDLTKMAADLLEGGNEEIFMYRDFQARNVMLVDGNPYFIDFQGGRKGPLYYDLASFVWQAKANYPTSLKEELIETYREALKKYVDIPKETFYKKLRLFVLFRTMQVLGAYGFRGYFEKKPHFLQSVPFAIDNLRKLINEEP